MKIRNDINGYTRLEYIEGTGAQSITIPTNLDCDYFEFQAQYTIANAEMCIVGNQDSGSANRWELFCDSSRPYFNLWTAYNSQGTTAGSVSALSKATVTYNYSTKQMIVNGTNTISKTLMAQPKYLFQYGGNNYYAKAKMFYFLEKKNNEIVMFLTPVKRDSDDKIGMYDLISKSFYPSTSSTDFNGGNILSSKLSVPPFYQQLEYIQFNGTSSAGQCIRTGVNQLVHPYYVKTVYNKTNTEVRDQCLVGQRQIGKFSNLYNTYYESAYGNTASGSLLENQKATLLMKSGEGVIVNGTNIKTTTSTSTVSTSYELLIGCFSEDSYTNAKWFYSGYIYEVEIMSNGEIIRHYIPCKRMSDGAVGLYDIINETFNENVKADSLTAGNVVNNTLIPKLSPKQCLYVQVEYLANSNGAQFLDIPFIPNYAKGFRFEFGFNVTATGKRYLLMSNYNTGTCQTSLELTADNKARLYMNSGNKDVKTSNTFTANSYNETILEFKNNVYTLTLNGTVTTGAYTCTSVSTATSMYAFLDRAKRTSTFPTPIKLYYIRICEEDELKFNLIPCKRLSDNVYGMYDTINKVFYSNQGTGAFTIGNAQRPLVII